jgi:hypothetical protein
MNDKVACSDCGAMILPSTAAANGGKCMPCQRGARNAIEQGKLRRAEERERRLNPDPATKHWRWMVNQVYRTPEGFAGLSAENQGFFAAFLLEGEVYNGGFHQYFSNSSADFFADAVRGFEEIGAMACARLALEAKQIVFGARDVPDSAARWDQIKRMGSAREKKLDELDRLFGQEAVKLRELAAEYARKHRLLDGF